ncbi:MAG: SAM-dependent methyltransferase, partial [Allobaculum sp.]|nr:SAM-dependent methyltransferase [Allobaculum sp.]
MPKLLSNPPFNMKWDGSPTVPSANANFAFVEKALKLSDRAAFIFPASILDSPDCKETSFRKMLIENNLLESVIKCPEKMFESTSISVCILTINKNKEDKGFMMIDASQFCEQEIREQAGQFGGKSHTNRIYKKALNIFSEEQISQIVEMVLKRISTVGLSQEVFQKEIEKQDWCFTPAR